MDWADVFGEGGTVTLPPGVLAAVFLEDDIAVRGKTDDTSFASSNKKGDPISAWRWDSGNVPAKDDLSNAYSLAKATLSGSDGETWELILYLGLERIDPSGSSHLDIEINQGHINTDKSEPCDSDQSDGAADGPPCEFTGSRSDKDLLLVMDFEQGAC